MADENRAQGLPQHAPAPDDAGHGRTTYDATTGFRDIKPPPQFSPLPLQSLLLGALLLTVLALAIAYFLRRGTKASKLGNRNKSIELF